MKKFVFGVAIVAFMSSCYTTRYSQTTHVTDYRPYTKEGFTITPSTSGFIYESIGNISIDFIPGKLEGYTTKVETKRGIYENHIFNPTQEYMTGEIVKKAKELGANALLDFRLTSITVSAHKTGYTASGLAVKLIK